MANDTKEAWQINVQFEHYEHNEHYGHDEHYERDKHDEHNEHYEPDEARGPVPNDLRNDLRSVIYET
jgi:hypothetical protein